VRWDRHLAPGAASDDPALRIGMVKTGAASSGVDPLLRSRLGMPHRADARTVCSFTPRYIPRKRCIVKLEVKMRAALGCRVSAILFFAKFYQPVMSACLYRNCQRLWHCGFSRGRFTIASRWLTTDWQVWFLSWENGPSLPRYCSAGRALFERGGAPSGCTTASCGFHGGDVTGVSRAPPYARRPEAQPDFGYIERRTFFGPFGGFNHIKHRFEVRSLLTGGPHTPRFFPKPHPGGPAYSPDWISMQFANMILCFDLAHFVAQLAILPGFVGRSIHGRARRPR